MRRSGVIDLLEEDPDRQLCLVSHHEGDKASTAQQVLLTALRDHYDSERLLSRRLFLRPGPASSNQARPLPSPRENTTRARSFLFLTTALALAASVSPATPVYIPENGFIGIKVPLTRARRGSYSTRTTYPHFLRDAVASVGVSNPILNPFRLKAKGEILQETRNPVLLLLKRLAPLSISRSHPEAARYVRRPQGKLRLLLPLPHPPSLNGWSWLGFIHRLRVGRTLGEGSPRPQHPTRGRPTSRDQRRLRRSAGPRHPPQRPIPDGEHGEFLRVWRAGPGRVAIVVRRGNRPDCLRYQGDLSGDLRQPDLRFVGSATDVVVGRGLLASPGVHTHRAVSPILEPFRPSGVSTNNRRTSQHHPANGFVAYNGTVGSAPAQ